MKDIIAFIGRAGSGKDYQCSLLERKGYKRLAFADTLREVASQIARINYNDLINNYTEFKEIGRSYKKLGKKSCVIWNKNF